MIDLSHLELVDGEGLQYDYHKHSTFLVPLIHVRSVGSQIAYSEDDNVNICKLRLHQELLQRREEPKRTKRNCKAIMPKQ